MTAALATDLVRAALADLDEVVATLPLGMRRARRALAVLDGVRDLAEPVALAREALDALTETRRNDDGLTGDDLHWARENAESWAFDQCENVAIVARHLQGAHDATPRPAICPRCY